MTAPLELEAFEATVPEVPHPVEGPVSCEAEVRKPSEQRLERDRDLSARERRAGTEVGRLAEREMVVRVAAYFPESKVLFMVDTVIPGVGNTFLPDWHLTGYVETMRRLLELDWDTFVPGHFWRLDRRDFADNLAFYELLASVAHEGLGAGIDADDYQQVRKYTYKRLDREWGHLFRFDEYAALNVMRFMLHHRTGGWGLEDVQ